jgi:hypothetical protein
MAAAKKLRASLSNASRKIWCLFLLTQVDRNLKCYILWTNHRDYDKPSQRLLFAISEGYSPTDLKNSLWFYIETPELRKCHNRQTVIRP